MQTFNKFFESNNFYIDVENPVSNFKPWLDDMQRMEIKIRANIFDKAGDDEDAEALIETLFGAVRRKRNSKFVDVKVVNPIPGVTVQDEYISVKSTKTMHSLETSVGNTNGFKLGSLIQFMFERLQVKIYRNRIFKERNQISPSLLLAEYNEHISNLYENIDDNLYNYAYVNGLLVFKVIKEFLKYLVDKNDIIENRNLITDVMVMSITMFMDKELKASKKYFDQIDDYLKVSKNRLEGFKKLKKDFIEFYKNMSPLFDKINGYDHIDIDVIPKFQDTYISYCILFFDNTDKKTGDEIINIYKTQPMRCSELFKNTAKAWLDNNFHTKQNKVGRGKNLYLNYEGVLKAFEGNGLKGRDVFDTVIKIRVPAKWNINFSEMEFNQSFKMFQKHIWLLNQPEHAEERDKFIRQNPDTRRLFPIIYDKR